MTEDLFEIIQKIHTDCHRLCVQLLGSDLSVAGNMGVFCKDDQEYEELMKLLVELTETSDNPKQKYFKLRDPFTISGSVYTYLYIRKPDPTPYGKYRGDIDFVMTDNEMNCLSKRW